MSMFPASINLTSVNGTQTDFFNEEAFSLPVDVKKENMTSLFTETISERFEEGSEPANLANRSIEIGGISSDAHQHLNEEAFLSSEFQWPDKIKNNATPMLSIEGWRVPFDLLQNYSYLCHEDSVFLFGGSYISTGERVYIECDVDSPYKQIGDLICTIDAYLQKEIIPPESLLDLYSKAILALAKSIKNYMLSENHALWFCDFTDPLIFSLNGLLKILRKNKATSFAFLDCLCQMEKLMDIAFQAFIDEDKNNICSVTKNKNFWSGLGRFSALKFKVDSLLLDMNGLERSLQNLEERKKYGIDNHCRSFITLLLEYTHGNKKKALEKVHLFASYAICVFNETLFLEDFSSIKEIIGEEGSLEFESSVCLFSAFIEKLLEDKDYIGAASLLQRLESLSQSPERQFCFLGEDLKKDLTLAQKFERSELSSICKKARKRLTGKFKEAYVEQKESLKAFLSISPGLKFELDEDKNILTVYAESDWDAQKIMDRVPQFAAATQYRSLNASFEAKINSYKSLLLFPLLEDVYSLLFSVHNYRRSRFVDFKKDMEPNFEKINKALTEGISTLKVSIDESTESLVIKGDNEESMSAFLKTLDLPEGCLDCKNLECSIAIVQQAVDPKKLKETIENLPASIEEFLYKERRPAIEKQIKEKYQKDFFPLKIRIILAPSDATLILDATNANNQLKRGLVALRPSHQIGNLFYFPLSLRELAESNSLSILDQVMAKSKEKASETGKKATGKRGAKGGKRGSAVQNRGGKSEQVIGHLPTASLAPRNPAFEGSQRSKITTTPNLVEKTKKNEASLDSEAMRIKWPKSKRVFKPSKKDSDVSLLFHPSLSNTFYGFIEEGIFPEALSGYKESFQNILKLGSYTNVGAGLKTVGRSERRKRGLEEDYNLKLKAVGPGIGNVRVYGRIIETTMVNGERKSLYCFDRLIPKAHTR